MAKRNSYTSPEMWDVSASVHPHEPRLRLTRGLKMRGRGEDMSTLNHSPAPSVEGHVCLGNLTMDFLSSMCKMLERSIRRKIIHPWDHLSRQDTGQERQPQPSPMTKPSPTAVCLTMWPRLCPEGRSLRSLPLLDFYSLTCFPCSPRKQATHGGLGFLICSQTPTRVSQAQRRDLTG